MEFDPKQHLIDIHGEAYLPVGWRVAWFRQDYPAETGWGLVTIPEEITQDGARYRANVVTPDGRIIASATGVAGATQFGDDYIPIAETRAIGRALALAGKGTQFCVADMAEGAIVDSPVARPGTANGDGEFGPPPTCPQCGAKMRLRRRKSDGNAFWGCEGYPECKGTAPAVKLSGEPDSPFAEPYPDDGGDSDA